MSNKHYEFDALIYAPIRYMLCVDERSFKKLMKTKNVVTDDIPAFIPSEGCAVTYLFDHNSTPKPFMLVNIPLNIDVSDAVIHRILIHESVHVWQHIREFMTNNIHSSDDTLWEFEAYAIDTIAYNLTETFFELRNKKKK